MSLISADISMNGGMSPSLFSSQAEYTSKEHQVGWFSKTVPLKIESSGHLAAPCYGPLILPRTIHSQRLKQQTSCDTDMAMLWTSMGCRWGDLWRDADEEDGKPAPITLW